MGGGFGWLALWWGQIRSSQQKKKMTTFFSLAVWLFSGWISPRQTRLSEFGPCKIRQFYKFWDCELSIKSVAEL